MNVAYNMDCMEAMKEFPDKFFDLAVVDPPYGIKYARGKHGWGVCENRPSLSDVAWDNAPSEDYFRELRRVSRHQIVWGGCTLLINSRHQSVGLFGTRFAKRRTRAFLLIAS